MRISVEKILILNVFVWTKLCQYNSQNDPHRPIPSQFSNQKTGKKHEFLNYFQITICHFLASSQKTVTESYIRYKILRASLSHFMANNRRGHLRVAENAFDQDQITDVRM